MSNELKFIPLSAIRKNPAAIREVDKSSEDYTQLVDSVKNLGILTPIQVRPYVDPETKVACYMLTDGLHRFTAAGDAGLVEIPAYIVDMDDKVAKISQLVANIHKVETRPVEYSKQLQRIMSDDPTYTIAKMSSTLNKSPQWVSERLGLTKLKEDLGKLVDEGKINLTNAYALAKLPEDEQENFKDRAIGMTPQEFVGIVQQRKKEIDMAKRQGRETAAEEFVAKPHVRKLSLLTAELENPKAGPDLCQKAGLGKAASKTEAAESGFKLGIQFALCVDPVSLDEAKKEWQEKVVDAKKKRDDAAKDRSAKKAADAKLKADRLGIEAEVRAAGGDVAAALKQFDDEHGLVNGKRPEAPAPAEVSEPVAS